MVEGHSPSKVEVTEDGRVVAARAAAEVKEELPRTVTVTVAAAQVGAVAVVVTGSVQLSPVMENLGV